MDPLLFDITLISRLVVGTLLGFAVGWEREHRGSFAGDRTFALVALGSSAFTAVGVENFPSTAEKVMAGVVSGIGFLGAGMNMAAVVAALMVFILELDNLPGLRRLGHDRKPATAQGDGSET